MSALKYSKAKKTIRANKIRNRGKVRIIRKATPGYFSYDDIRKANDSLIRGDGEALTLSTASQLPEIKAILEKASTSLTPQKINDAWKKACLQSKY